MMQKFTSTFLCFLFLGWLVAQPCGTNNSSVCSPPDANLPYGFGDINNIPCAIKGQYYYHTISFKMYETFSFLGQNISVDSIEFVSITNLPCGLCWAANRTEKRYKKNENGCIVFAGTTNDPSGQYKLAITLRAWINNNPQPISVPPNLTDQAGIKLFVRVKNDPQSNCPAVDTSSGFQGNLTANTGCPVSVRDITVPVTDISISPNPMTDNAYVTFQSTASGTATINIFDLAGKTVRSYTLSVKAGNNIDVIHREGMIAGAYFYSLTFNGSSATRHFIITD
ncbi:MAG: T9SS type A sorting domain-containing protein [Chitinophagales bacterium]|nr:T9SS type A sorting domain-containing protein [Chitinophagales bacterium]MDW8419478.1 T9SS type A sorting domain-containing protein [Chitinophagales bacterium]